MKALEKYYTVPEASLLLGLCTKTVWRKLKAKEFGDQVVNLGSVERPEYRIPASGLNEYLNRHRVFSEPGVAARSVGELRRKVALDAKEAA